MPKQLACNAVNGGEWRNLTTTLCLLLGLAQTSHAAQTLHHVNVSPAAQGIQTNISWVAHDAALKKSCADACRYWQISAALIDPALPWTISPATWPTVSTTTSGNPAPVKLTTAAPTDEKTSQGKLVIYDSPLLRKAAVSFSSGDKTVRVQVQRSGSASAKMVYHVRVRNQASANRDFYVRFRAPVSKRSYSNAHEKGGPSGNQPMPIGPDWGRARSSVDVLVDGIPVWFTATSVHTPNLFPADDAIFQDFGADAKDDFYFLYLGRYEGGGTFTLDYIVRGDVYAKADECGDDFESGPKPVVRRHCLQMGEGRDIPTGSVNGYRFEIYSTPALKLIPGSDKPL